MKAVLSVWMLCTSLAVLAASAPPSQLERVSIGGREYVRLADWARLNGFQSAWLSKQEFSLSNSTARICFAVNAQKILLNGMAVWLSAPIALHNAAACITPLDLQATLQPLLRPKRSSLFRSSTRPAAPATSSSRPRAGSRPTSRASPRAGPPPPPSTATPSGKSSPAASTGST